MNRPRYCPCTGDGYVADPECVLCGGSGLKPPEELSDEARALGVEPIPADFPFDRDGSHISGSRRR